MTFATPRPGLPSHARLPAANSFRCHRRADVCTCDFFTKSTPRCGGAASYPEEDRQRAEPFVRAFASASPVHSDVVDIIFRLFVFTLSTPCCHRAAIPTTENTLRRLALRAVGVGCRSGGVVVKGNLGSTAARIFVRKRDEKAWSCHCCIPTASNPKRRHLSVQKLDWQAGHNVDGRVFRQATSFF